MEPSTHDQLMAISRQFHRMPYGTMCHFESPLHHDIDEALAVIARNLDQLLAALDAVARGAEADQVELRKYRGIIAAVRTLAREVAET